MRSQPHTGLPRVVREFAHQYSLGSRTEKVTAPATPKTTRAVTFMAPAIPMSRRVGAVASWAPCAAEDGI